MKTSDLAAVLTGDIVGSTRVGPAVTETSMRIIEMTAREATSPGGFFRFRGDGWQMLIEQPTLALRWAVLIAARLAARSGTVPTRIAISIGTVTSRGTSDLGDASGPAFERSGRALDDMARGERLILDAAEVGHAARAVAILLDERIQRWTREQAEAAALFLHPNRPASKDVAKVLGITPQAASQRLIGAGAHAIGEALNGLETDIERKLAG